MTPTDASASEAARPSKAILLPALGYADANAQLLKAELVRRIQHRISADSMAQVRPAQLMGISQPILSTMLKANAEAWALDRKTGFAPSAA